MNALRHIDLFSGIGGFALAARWAGIETAVFCEQDEWCRRVLKKHWPDISCVGDIRDFDGASYRGAWLLTGGFPCQPFSCAGKRMGKADDRYLWPEMRRVIDESRPTWVLGENVAGIIKMELDGSLSDLEALGYACQAFVIPACAVDAPHRRDRVWIVAHDNRQWELQQGRLECNQRQWSGHDGAHVAYSKGEREREQANQANAITNSWSPWDEPFNHGPYVPESRITGQREYCRWRTEPGMGRVAPGIPNRMDRLRGLGNSIVPAVAYEIIRSLNIFDVREDKCRA